MDKLAKTILIITIAVFGAGFLFVPSTFAQDNLVVEYWSGTEWLSLQGPIFSETNFLPGQEVTRLVRVTNNSGQTQRIATEAINKNDPERLGDVLNLEIKEGGVTRYNNALSSFFNAGEVYLSDLANGATTQYDFIATFYYGAQNPFQGRSLNFDILVGFQGTEGGILPGAGGGAGGALPPGLSIYSESVKITAVEETSVTITWTTSYFSTSQVIYAKEGEAHILDLTDTSGTPPKYGYARTTPEFDISPKVTSHLVIITGLTPGTKYYYRTVSHASLAISQEYSFTTLGETEVQTEEEIETSAETEEAGVVLGEEAEKREQEIKEITEEEKGGLEEEQEQTVEQQGQEEKTEVELKQELPLLAAVGNILSFGIGNVWIAVIIGIVILALLIFIVFRITRKVKKGNFENNLKK